MQPEGIHKNSDIEVLRAVAISFTLIAHLIWGIMPKLGGLGRHVHAIFQFWTGVDLFFAISGFLITTSLLRAWRDHLASPAPRRTWSNFFTLARPFWIRRIFRLLPSAWLWIGITLLLAGLFNRHASLGDFPGNVREATAAMLNVSNFYYHSWFSKGNLHYGSFGIFWSLSLEEQFYLLFPFLLFFLDRRVLLPLLAAAFLLQVFLDRPNGFEPHHASLLWFIRTDALILGVLIAFWRSQTAYRRLEPRALRRPVVGLPVVGTIVLLLAAVPAWSLATTLSTGLVAVISGLLVWIASYDRDYILPAGKTKNALVWLGSRSYSIYLIHTICRAAIVELKITAGIPEGSFVAAVWTVLSLVLILLIAEMNYRLVETRFRRRGRRIASARSATSASLALGQPARVPD